MPAEGTFLRAGIPEQYVSWLVSNHRCQLDKDEHQCARNYAD